MENNVMVFLLDNIGMIEFLILLYCVIGFFYAQDVIEDINEVEYLYKYTFSKFVKFMAMLFVSVFWPVIFLMRLGSTIYLVLKKGDK